MNKQTKLFHYIANNNHTGHCEESDLCGRRSNLPEQRNCPTQLYCMPTRNNDNAGYVLIITLLAMVALTIAGMGAMMVATTDVSLSGNQRTQIAAQQASITGVNTGMANLCSHSYLVAGNPNYIASSINGTYINKPVSSPQTSFYNGIYSSPVPTVNAGSSYAVGYFTPTVNPNLPISQLASVYGPSSVSGSRASTLPTSFGFGGSTYTIGPVMGTAGTANMECEQIVYYGAPK